MQFLSSAVILLLFVAPFHANSITIDPTNGNDTTECLTGNGSCKTIGYVFNKTEDDTIITLVSDTFETEMGGILLNRSNITVCGQGETSIITGSDTDPKTTFYCSETDDLTLKNFLVKSDGDGMITLSSSNRITIEGVLFQQESIDTSEKGFIPAYILFSCTEVTITLSYDISVSDGVCSSFSFSLTVIFLFFLYSFFYSYILISFHLSSIILYSFTLPYSTFLSFVYLVAYFGYL